MKKRAKETIPAPEFYTVSQFAELLQLNEMTIYRFVKSGQLPHYQLGRMMRFHRDDVEGFLKERRVAAHKRKP